MAGPGCPAGVNLASLYDFELDVSYYCHLILYSDNSLCTFLPRIQFITTVFNILGYHRQHIMPIFGIGKSLDDIESHRYSNWGSMSGSGLTGSVENSLSRSQRCFQVGSAGETNGNQNFYSSTRNLTPGPGSYEGRYF